MTTWRNLLRKTKTYELSTPLKKGEIYTVTVNDDLDKPLEVWLGDDYYVSINDTFTAPSNANIQTLTIKSLYNPIIKTVKLESGSNSSLYTRAPENIADEIPPVRKAIRTVNLSSDILGEKYLHTAYADTVTGRGIEELPEEKKFIGHVVTNSKNPPEKENLYNWVEVVGASEGNGISDLTGNYERWVWVKYADTIDGIGMSNYPEGKSYIGIATEKTAQKSSTISEDYRWYKLHSEEGKEAIRTLQSELKAAVQSGGRNLVILKDDPNYRLTSNNTAMYPIQDEAYENHRRVRRTYTGTDQGNVMSTYSPRLVENIVAGEEYTQVLWVKPEESMRLGITPSQLFDCPNGEWTIIWRVSKPTANEVRFPSIKSEEIFSPEFTPWIEYKDPMVIKGSIPPEFYTRAPEDIEADIAAASENNNSIETFAFQDGKKRYLHIAYADGVLGHGFSWLPEGKTRIGHHVSLSKTPSANPSDYVWRLFSEAGIGPQGVQTSNDSGGRPIYTWIRYADNELGQGMSNDPTGKTYIGLGLNKFSPIESTNPRDYRWSPIYNVGGGISVQSS